MYHWKFHWTSIIKFIYCFSENHHMKNTLWELMVFQKNYLETALVVHSPGPMPNHGLCSCDKFPGLCLYSHSLCLLSTLFLTVSFCKFFFNLFCCLPPELRCFNCCVASIRGYSFKSIIFWGVFQSRKLCKLPSSSYCSIEGAFSDTAEIQVFAFSIPVLMLFNLINTPERASLSRRSSYVY